ncbi:MAG: 30S ribosomal protein S5 [Candidatus Xenolissoclinum pacificiensis L6]|uniref:Small ribosomal subunit protein uS5 n=1 Tax=Candidatus Xenolissoclinum pacificiensis L6 TaxID=1401685 RepID=W2V1J9_9RICK|nr:MAG: 30S ribosomal protein S5 [Candidatus Xenolissoclinum pacificiensis L6]
MKNKAEAKGLDLKVVVIYVGRVTAVKAKGRIFLFRVGVVVGDMKGNVGYAIAKHSELSEAKEKAIQKAKKSITKIGLRQNRTLHHGVFCKYGASKLLFKPANPGTGIIAGGVVRKFCEIAGIRDVIVKSYGSSCPHAMIRNIFQSFREIYPLKYIATKRGKKVIDIIRNRI